MRSSAGSAELGPADAARRLLSLLRTRTEGEVFVELGSRVVAELSDGRRTMAASRLDGVAVRQRRSSASTFAHTNSVTSAAVQRLLADVRLLDVRLPEVAGTGGSRADPAVATGCAPDRDRREAARRAAGRLLDDIEGAAAEQGATNLTARVSASWRTTGIAAHDGRVGTHTADYIFVTVALQRGAERGSASHALAANEGIEPGAGAELVSAAVADATSLATAGAPNSGHYRVLFAPTAAGLLVHEAIGHPLEADTALRGSALWRLRDCPFTSPVLHVTEDPTSPDAWEPATVDEEACRTRSVVLIDSGAVRAVVSDLATAGRLGGQTTGHARRGSFASPPLPRVRHTVVAGGTEDEADLVAAGDGILVERILAADADPARGRFTIRVARGRRIRSGRLTETLRDFSVRGDLDTFRTLDGIARCGEPGRAFCGRAGHWLPISYSAPAMNFGRLAVHGRNDH